MNDSNYVVDLIININWYGSIFLFFVIKTKPSFDFSVLLEADFRLLSTEYTYALYGPSAISLDKVHFSVVGFMCGSAEIYLQ